MSTRTNIVIKHGDSTIYIYRHHDGYLAETGADLLTKLAAVVGTPECHMSVEGMADKFVRSIFAEYYEQQSYETTPKAVYELTTELHGDIEHAYYIEFGEHFNTGPVSIRHAARPDNWHSEDVEVEDWARIAKRYSVDSFRAAVNKDREACNARIRELKAKNPGSAYANCGEYEMLVAA